MNLLAVNVQFTRDQWAGTGPVAQLGRDENAVAMQALVLQGELENCGYRTVGESRLWVRDFTFRKLFSDKRSRCLSRRKTVFLYAGHQEVTVVACAK